MLAIAWPHALKLVLAMGGVIAWLVIGITLVVKPAKADRISAWLSGGRVSAQPPVQGNRVGTRFTGALLAFMCGFAAFRLLQQLLQLWAEG